MAHRRTSTATPTTPVSKISAATAVTAAVTRESETTWSDAPPTTATSVATESKQARIIALLRRAEGATIAELMAATGWMSHSVRGTLSAVVKRKLGLTLESGLEDDRGRVYRIAPPPVVKPVRRGKSKAPASAPSARAAA